MKKICTDIKYFVFLRRYYSRVNLFEAMVGFKSRITYRTRGLAGITVCILVDRLLAGDLSSAFFIANN